MLDGLKAGLLDVGWFEGWMVGCWMVKRLDG